MSLISETPTDALVVRHKFVMIWTILFFLSGVSFGQEIGFTEDAPSAIERAKVEKKDVIFLFTGSDWCPPCKKLEKEVLSEKEFLDEISKQYVLVKIYFQRNIPQDSEIEKQNDGYSKK